MRTKALYCVTAVILLIGVVGACIIAFNDACTVYLINAGSTQLARAQLWQVTEDGRQSLEVNAVPAHSVATSEFPIADGREVIILLQTDKGPVEASLGTVTGKHVKQMFIVIDAGTVKMVYYR